MPMLARWLSFVFVLAVVVAQGPLQVEITPRGKESFAATWSVSTIAIDTEFGSATVKAQKLAQIVFGEPVVILTDAGVELRGELKQKAFDVKVDGKPRKLQAAELAALVVVRDGKPLGMPQFGGEWMSSFGPVRLQQRGASVKGDYGFDGNGTIEGAIKNGVLEFVYRDDGGSGGGNWRLDDSAGLLLGRYGKNGKDEGFWGAYRKQPAVPPLQPGAVVTGQTDSGLRFHARAPKAHAAGSRWPAICILHGSNMTSHAYVDTIVAAWPELAEQFVVLGLDGERLSEASKTGAPVFNYTYVNFGGPEVGPPWAHRQSPALVAAALEQLGKQLPVDEWYLGGHSQGGFLTYCLVMYYPQLLAGAFPMSCNLLVQCEPDEFEPEQNKRQHEVAVAVIHGRDDDVVDFDGGAYCHLRLLDGGFPRVRLFAPDGIAHQFALLPVAEAVQWLRGHRRQGDELLAFAAARAKDSAWRDVGAVLQRVVAAAARDERVVALQQQLEAAAAGGAGQLEQDIRADRDGAWADAYLQFAADFGTAKRAAPVLAAYAVLRRQQRERGDELFLQARRADDQQQRRTLWQQIMATCYATKWYAAVKLWSQ